MNANAGLLTSGDPYIARYWWEEGGKTMKKRCPHILNQYFSYAHVMNNHNMSRQGKLALDKAWKTHCPWFQIFTSIIGTCLIDSRKSYKWAVKGGPFKSKISKYRHHKHYGISGLKFAEIVGSAIVRYYKPGVVSSQPYVHEDSIVRFNLSTGGDHWDGPPEDDDSVVVVPTPVSKKKKDNPDEEVQ